MPDRIPRARSPRPTLRPRQEPTPDQEESKRFLNSGAWRRLRRIVLARQPLCSECEREGRIVPAKEVHHVQSRRDRPDLALTESNLIGLCSRHHAQATMRERVARKDQD